MNTKQILIITLSILSNFLQSQPWMKNIKSENPNFFEIRSAFNDYWKERPIEKGQGYKQFKRWEYYWEQRVNKNGEFPSANILHDELQKYNLSHTVLKTTAAISATTANWAAKGPNTSLGGYSGIGRINCIAFHPTLQNTFWVGTPAGGLWKTTNGGTTWSTNTDNLPVLGISDIAIDPTNPNTIYIATGDGDAAYNLQNGLGDTKSVGILKSTNGGVTWSSVLTASVSSNILIRRLIINPSNPQILLAATSIGIYRTVNGGSTWSLVSSSIWFMDLEFKPTDPNYVYATTFSNSGNAQIYQSSNNGISWTQITSFSTYNRIKLAVSANSPNLVDAACVNTANGLGGLWYSANSGASYTQYFNAGGTCASNLLNSCAPGSLGCGGQGSYDLAYAINPSNSNEIWLGGINTWRSTDGGTNWNVRNFWTPGATICGSNPGVATVHADKHWLAFHPLNNSLVFECNDGGLYVTNNGGSTWTDLSNGLEISQLYRLGTSATINDKVICGLQDNGSKLFQTSSWNDVTGGDGMECIIDYTNSNIQYATYVKGLIYKTTNNWGSNSAIVQNTASAGVHEAGHWVTPYIMHPTNNNILLVGKSQVYQTLNGGSTWSQLGTLPGATGNLVSMAYAPSNPSVIYVATYNEVFKTINGGASWTAIATSTNNITYIAVDPTNPLRFWITLSGYTAGTKVFYSNDGGVTFSNFSGTLPNIPVNCMVYQKNTNDGLYIGTDVGVYYRNASMSDWIFYNTGLPNVIVTELEISYNNNKLWAATFGRGLWNSDLYCPILSQPGSITGVNTLCSGSGATTFSIPAVSGATTYVWSLPGGWSGSSSSTSINASPGVSGNISVAASNSCGISTAQNIFVTVNLLPIVNATSSNPVLCVGQSETLTATGATTYTWSSGGTSATEVISPTVNTTYTVNGTDGNGCSNSTSITQSVTVCTGIVSLKGIELKNVTIFPNPTNGIVNVISTGSINEVQILNTLGQVVHQSVITNQQTSINIQQLSNGIYFIKVLEGNKVAGMQKMFKE
jgi:photosystem II stability/assembly factor-like uncharacterized protein